MKHYASIFCVALFATATLGSLSMAESHATIPPNYAAKNVRVVGYTDLEGRPPFKLAIQEVDDRWLLYAGHLWHRGWSIVDVTQPDKPRLEKFIEGPENTWTIQMEVEDGKMLTSVEAIAPGWGGNPDGPEAEKGVLIWDLADPLNPVRVGHFKTEGDHRDFYGGGRYAHLSAQMPGYAGHIYVAIDLTDPSKPVEAGRWWTPGQHTAGGEPEPVAPINHHGPAYVEGNRAYIGSFAAGVVILDISEIGSPKLEAQLDFSPPFLDFIGVHTVLPVLERELLIVLSESIAEDCKEPLNHASLVSVANPAKPHLVSIFPVPEPPPGSPHRNFCEKGGRFGPHNLNNHQHSPFVQRQGDLVYVTYFNAGLRIFDISDPYLPKEVGYFIPPEPTQRYGTKPVRVLTAQTEDVLVDRRGYIYITNKNQGMWILQYTED